MNEAMFNNQFKYSQYIPFDPTIRPIYTPNYGNAGRGGVQPYVYTNWKDEHLSWYDNCYIHTGLNPANTYWFKGPDSMKFLSENFTNGFKTFQIGKCKHGVMVNEDGLMMIDGLLLRLGEDEFITYWMHPIVENAIKKGGYNIQGKNITGEVFMHQLGGPRSLEIIEAATGEDFHDLSFAAFRNSTIDGHKVMIIRIGMSGSLAYEVHGDLEDSIPVFEKIMEVGKEYGIRRLGQQAYWNTHTENGFPQHLIHFFNVWEKDESYEEFRKSLGITLASGGESNLTGSYSKNYSDWFFNPYELGWGHMVNFNHDFVGKEALLKIKDQPHREMRTLVWSVEDILDIHRSQFEGEVPYFDIEGPEDMVINGGSEYRGDKVLDGDKCIGITTGRCFSWHYRQMLSLVVIEPEYAELGTEVTILWGDEGSRQKKIRATVSRFPYMNESRNENVDTSTIPSGLK